MRFLPPDLPGGMIETSATPEQNARLLARARAAWDYFGTLSPHFATGPDGYPAAAASAAVETFWASGEREAEGLERLLARHGLPPLGGRVCVDFGCGIGRLTVALASRCATVHAYDISAVHLAHARQGLAARGLTNVVLHHCRDDAISLVTQADLVVSILTLQHNPPPVIAAIVEELLAALCAGGVAIIQVPTQIRNYGFGLAEFTELDLPIGLEMHCLKQVDLFGIIRAAGCELIEIREDDRLDDPDSILSNTLVIRRKDRPKRSGAASAAILEPVVSFPMGWDVPEDWGVWTNDDQAMLSIEVPAEAPATLDLDFSLQTFVPFPNAALAIDVTTNAERSEAWTFRHIDFRRGEVRRILRGVRTIERAGRRFIEIDFLLRGAVSPREAGLAEDDRRLGIGFKNVALRQSLPPIKRGFIARLRAAFSPE